MCIHISLILLAKIINFVVAVTGDGSYSWGCSFGFIFCVCDIPFLWGRLVKRIGCSLPFPSCHPAGSLNVKQE